MINLSSILFFTSIIIISISFSLIECQSCIYGSDTSCLFPCHCKNTEDCDSGMCKNNECENVPGDFSEDNVWSGATCQIGNVGLRKPATQSATLSTYYADRALDGRYDSLAIPYIDGCINGLAWWQVNLLAPHVVSEVKIYNAPYEEGYKSVGHFNILIGTTEDTYQNGKICETLNDVIPYNRSTTLLLNCHEPVITKYVAIKRFGGYHPGCMNIVEVIVKGYKYVNPCPEGTYGNVCHLRCTHCKQLNCSRNNGSCGWECQPFYYTDNCSKLADQIDVDPATEYHIEISDITYTSAKIKWIGERNIPSEAMKFYYYVLHLLSTANSSVVIEKALPHNSVDAKFETTFSGLHRGSGYEIFITPQRRDKGIIENGKSSKRIAFLTKGDDFQPSGVNLILIICLSIAVALLLAAVVAFILLARRCWTVNSGVENMDDYENTANTTPKSRESEYYQSM